MREAHDGDATLPQLQPQQIQDKANNKQAQRQPNHDKRDTGSVVTGLYLRTHFPGHVKKHLLSTIREENDDKTVEN